MHKLPQEALQSVHHETPSVDPLPQVALHSGLFLKVTVSCWLALTN